MRHPVLLSLWAILVALTGLSLTSSGWFVLVFLASPFVALATLAAVLSGERSRCSATAGHASTASRAVASPSRRGRA